MDLGTMVEGIVELEPMSGRMVLRIQQADGSNVFLDVQECMERYQGKEVRFILTPMSTVAEVAKMVAAGMETS
jgi:hypothetical protein